MSSIEFHKECGTHGTSGLHLDHVQAKSLPQGMWNPWAHQHNRPQTNPSKSIEINSNQYKSIGIDKNLVMLWESWKCIEKYNMVHNCMKTMQHEIKCAPDGPKGAMGPMGPWDPMGHGLEGRDTWGTNGRDVRNGGRAEGLTCGRTNAWSPITSAAIAPWIS